MTTELGVRLSPCVLSADSIRAVELPPWMCSTPIGSGRRPSLRQAWLMNPSLRIVVVETATGQFELTAAQRGIQQLLSQVDQIAH